MVCSENQEIFNRFLWLLHEAKCSSGVFQGLAEFSFAFGGFTFPKLRDMRTKAHLRPVKWNS